MDNTLNYSSLAGITEEILRSGNPCRLFVGGNSMYPHLRRGDYATIVKTPVGELQKGDVIVFSTAAKFVAHRLISVVQNSEGLLLITKGDSLKKSDTPVNPAQYFGRIAAIERRGRSISFDTTYRRFLNRWLARITFYTPPVYSIFRFFRHLFRKNHTQAPL